MIVSEFLARLGVKVDGKGFASAEMRMRALGSGLQTLAGGFATLFAVGAVKNFVQSLTAQGAALKDMSDRTGLSTAALQEYGLAAQLAGSSQESLETGLKFLSRNSVEAAGGSKEMAKAFRDAGISLKDTAGRARPTEALLGDLADTMQRTEDPGKRTALAMKLLGRSGAELVPLLKDGAAGLAAVRQEAIDLGGGLSEELVKNADELDDNLTRLQFSMLGLKSVMGNVLLPVIDRVVRGIIGFVTATQKFLRANRFIQLSLTLLTAAVLAWGIANLWATRKTIAAWLKAAAPFIAIAAVLLLVAAALDDVHSLLTGGKSLLGQYIDEWFGIGKADEFVRSWTSGIESLTETVKAFFTALASTGELVDALVHGDFVRAANTALGKWITGAVDDVSQAGRAYANTLRGTDIPAARAGGRGLGSATDESVAGTPRAQARGLAASLAPGSAGFGQASAGTAAGVKGALGFAPAPAGGAAPVSVGGTSVTVVAPPGSNERELARQAEQAAKRVNAQQAKDLRAALAPKAARAAGTLAGFAGTLELP